MKVYLYYNGKCIKKVKEIKDNYSIIVIGNKKLFGYFITRIVIKPVRLLINGEKEIHLGCVLEEGTEIRKE